MKIGSLLRWFTCIAAGLGLFAATLEVKADIRLAQLCSKANTGTAVCTGTTSYDYPTPNSLVNVQGKSWYFFSTVRENAVVSVCGSDVNRGALSCPSTVLVTKALVPLKVQTEPQPPIPTRFYDLPLTWAAPQTKVVDGKTYPIVEGDITGYRISWTGGGLSGDQTLPATQLAVSLNLPIAPSCVRFTTIGPESSSNGREHCFEAKTAKPGDPVSYTVTFLPDAPK